MARILVIDDHDQIRHVSFRVLESAGHEVIEAGHGQEAIGVHRARRADVVITDIFMPGKDGLEVIAELQREAPGLKVIAMSGGDPQGEISGLEVAELIGAFATLQKPFDLSVMLETVERALAA